MIERSLVENVRIWSIARSNVVVGSSNEKQLGDARRNIAHFLCRVFIETTKYVLQYMSKICGTRRIVYIRSLRRALVSYQLVCRVRLTWFCARDIILLADSIQYLAYPIDTIKDAKYTLWNAEFQFDDCYVLSQYHSTLVRVGEG